MKIMRNSIVIILAMTIFMTSAIANDGRMKEKAASQIEYLTIILDLDQEQVSAIESLQETHLESLEEIHAKYKPVLDEMTGKLKELHQKEDSDKKHSMDEARDIRQSYHEQLEPMREAIESEKESFDQVLAGVFNETQSSKFQELQVFKDKQRMKHEQQHGPKGKPCPGMKKGHKPDHKGHPGHGPKPMERQESPE